MKRKSVGVIVSVGIFLSVLVALAMAAQDKYTVKVPMGSRSLSSEDTRAGRLSPSVRTDHCCDPR